MIVIILSDCGEKRIFIYLRIFSEITDNHILTSKDFYEWAKDYFKNLICLYYSKDDYTDASKKLKPRFESAKTIPGTLLYHCFQVLGRSSRLLLKQFSESEASTLYPPIREEKNKKVNLGTNNKVKKVTQKKSIKN